MCTLLYQNIDPRSNHIILRKDEGYFHPYASYQLIPTEFSGLYRKHKWHDSDKIKFGYYHGKILSLSQNFHNYSTLQNNFTVTRHQGCHSMIIGPDFYLPTQLTVLATEMPNRLIKNTFLTSFNFSSQYGVGT